MNKLLKLNLQMFGEGGDGAGASEGAGSEAGAFEDAAKNAKVAAAQTGASDDLSDVIYGIPTEDNESSASEDTTKAEDSKPAKTKSQEFEELIKGKYHDEYTERSQKMIDKRFKQMKQMESRLQSQDSILEMLSEKYGTKAGDIEALSKAINDDESFFEDEALKRGLSVEQYKELRSLQKENEEFRKAQEEAEARSHGEEIYKDWLAQAEELKAKYGLADFDLSVEVQNPMFVELLKNPAITLEGAYKAIHFDDMVGGAMAQTAKNVTEKMAQGIAQRASRPSENGISSTHTSNFKTDVNSLTDADLREIRRRVERGAVISF